MVAFDHRHIFIDPTPDVARSFAERQRLFNLPRTNWDDYDKSLISKGGGVYPRGAKSIALSPEARAVIGIDAEELPPLELLKAILQAPVDLLYNGGIGTYVKASFETHAQVGDKASDAFQVNGSELRCKVVEAGDLCQDQRVRRTGGPTRAGRWSRTARTRLFVSKYLTTVNSRVVAQMKSYEKSVTNQRSI